MTTNNVEYDTLEYSCSIMNFISDNFTDMTNEDQDRVLSVLKSQLIHESILRDIAKNLYNSKKCDN